MGLKSDLFNNTLRLNIAVFFAEMDDFQVLEFTGVQFVTFNVAKAETTGTEVEFIWSPLSQLTLNGSLTWSDAKYPDDCEDPVHPVGTPQSLCGLPLTNAP